jgi:hypothetical protein
MSLSMRLIEFAILGGVTGFVLMVVSCAAGFLGTFLYYAFGW